MVIRVRPIVAIVAITITASAYGCRRRPLAGEDLDAGGTTALDAGASDQPNGTTDASDPADEYLPCGVAGEGDVLSLAHSPDGTLLAVGRGAGWIDILDATSGAPHRRLLGAGRSASSLVFSADGGLLAETSVRGYPPAVSLRIWRVGDGALIRELPSAGQLSGGFSPDGSEIATPAFEGNSPSLQIHSVASGALVRTLDLPPPIQAAAVSPDWTRIAVLRPDFAIDLLTLANAEQIQSLRAPRNTFDAPVAVAFSPGAGDRLAAFSQQTVEVIGIADGVTRAFGRSYGNNALAFGSDGRTIAWSRRAAAGSEVAVVRVDTGEVVAFPEPGAPAQALSIAPGDDLVATGGADNVLRIWSVSARTPLYEQVPTGHGAPVRTLVASGDGRLLATIGWDASVRIWNAGDPPSEARRIALPGWGTGAALALSPDSTVLAGSAEIGNGDSAVFAWRTQDGNELWRQSAYAPAGGLAFSPDGTLLASPGPSTGSRVPLALRRASDGTVLLAIDTAPVVCCDAIAFSPDGSLVAVGATGTGDGVHIHHVADGSEVARLSPRSRRVGALAFSPDGSWLVVGGDGGPPEIWGVADGFRARAEEAAGTAADALVLPSGGRVVTASGWDLVLWSPGDGLVKQRLWGHAGDVWSLASAQGGRLLISAGFDETLRLWCRGTP